MPEKNMRGLFLHTVKDVYYAEHEILKALPGMAAAAQRQELKAAFETHRGQTERQVERLEQVFRLLGEKAEGVPCEAIKGILAESDELLEEAPEPSPVRDAGLLAGTQAVEHYEIARYGTLIAWAKASGKPEVVALLQQSLDEEKATDKILSVLADKKVNPMAAKAA